MQMTIQFLTWDMHHKYGGNNPKLIVKSNESNSWFIEIKNILRKYNILEAWWYLDNAPKKAIWTIAVKRKLLNTGASQL
jgi:hypothetical protein